MDRNFFKKGGCEQSESVDVCGCSYCALKSKYTPYVWHAHYSWLNEIILSYRNILERLVSFLNLPSYTSLKTVVLHYFMRKETQWVLQYLYVEVL